MRSGTIHRLLPGLLPSLLLGSLACHEDGVGPTAPASEPASAVAPAAALTFTSIAAGGSHSCALVADGRAFCWGANLDGQLGDGTHTSRLRPVAVAGGLRFVQISAGSDYTCAITTDERAYCWGGFRGDTPTQVPGGRRFRNVNAGNNHTCAVNPFDVGFCWGPNNFFGQLGTGGGFSLSPVRIAGGLRWRRVEAGGQYSCGVTTDDKAYCWGFQVGPKPVAVPGGLRFRQVTAGGGAFTDAQQEEPDLPHACGITPDDRAYCWGHGGSGQLGSGTGSSGQSPVAVAGNRRWRQIVAGHYHTCGVTRANVAFCWGYNEWGYNGNGTTNSSSVPVRVAGNIAFASISTGTPGLHTCALTPDGRAYCWGDNGDGQLGDGTRTRRLTPVAVMGSS